VHGCAIRRQQIEYGLAQNVGPLDVEELLERRVDLLVAALGIFHIDGQRYGFEQLFHEVQLLLQALHQCVVGRDVRADGDILIGLPPSSRKGTMVACTQYRLPSLARLQTWLSHTRPERMVSHILAKNSFGW
jgi:hypothetical protein